MKTFLLIKNPDQLHSLFPMEYQLQSLDEKYLETPYKVGPVNTYALRVYETDQSYFSVGNKKWFVFFDDNSEIRMTQWYYETIFSQDCWTLLDQLLTLLSDAIRTGTCRLSLAEYNSVLAHLAAINEQVPGSGLTLQQVHYIRKQSFGGYLNQTFLDLLDAHVHDKRIYKHAIEQLALLRVGGNVKAMLAVPEVKTVLPLRFLFISYASLWHQDVWNNLSVETLIGDLLGEYGNEVECSHIRIFDVSEIPDALVLVEQIKPDVIGFSLEIRTLKIHEIFESAYRKKAGTSKAPLILYGNTVPTYASSYFVEKFLREPKQSMVILGYGEESMRQVVLYQRNQCDITAIPNAVWRDEAGCIRHNPRRYDASLVIYPPVQFEVNPGSSHMLEASRGCRFNCTFCAQGPHSKWDPVPVDRVITNIEFLLSRGVHELEFVDNEFFGGRNDALIARASQITNAIRKLSEKYGVKAAFRIFTNPLIIAKADEQQAGTNQKMKELLHYMKNCGLKRLYIGIEAASEEQRKRFNRKDTIQDVILAIQVVRELEIALDAGFIMFDPLMNLQDIKENVNFYKTYNLLEANTWPHRDLCVLFDTPMLHLLKKKGLITGVDYYELVYTYQYASQDMAYFANTVLEFGAKTGKLFQVLKYSTKELFNEQLKHQALLFSRKMVDENAKIFLELMDNMVQCLEQGSRDYGKCLESAWRAMVNLIKEIEKSLVIYDTNSAHYPKLVKNLDEAKKQLGMSNLEQIS
ncbi:B12-binding domain-containing radical SAM protein|uniref:Radical SAM superfamily enzyme YgiQ, UPF0313 family n=1 Tax=Dendrosporobacter quercicolus TaxID=146817 RepID=A0A1G9MWA6_9FIRM|nr:radical SAM protein [Dendrosporobacter quercicolus]NSL47159.1 B12-binding domain-containing radical SAM protein [Dendrosporobacter quercicolus DSM 1736]SDL78562.1 Radical SAM superfamily enzyme YgiQ, UPF0313 family [Dendrosporobacter quercicolus]